MSVRTGARPGDLLATAQHIYRAAIDPSIWSSVLTRVLADVGCSQGVLCIAASGDASLGQTVASANIDPELDTRWRGEFGARNCPGKTR